MSAIDLQPLQRVAEIEFSDIVVETLSQDLNELRIMLVDSSFIDVWYSLILADRCSYHWERRAIDGTIYRHDNAPHRRWQFVSTFPWHFHNGSEQNVVDSYISADPAQALREMLQFARSLLAEVA